MGLAALRVWVDAGFGFGKSSCGYALWLYLTHVALCVTWEPLVLGTSNRVALGFIFCLIKVVAVYAEFRKVNMVAGLLVKPCVAWVALLTLVTTFRFVDDSKAVT
ncbi:hypothetical protein QQ045_033537 [Rhodiola kirilowii]